ncbi:VOC family protein [Algoriphagus sp. D3-2-R+10]|uniref:VOC family protein n=1 Tax=Algoriphagus aurantiacus TaxID=3103948 RepID=UPI002B3D0037|nr:VOC family protein [Algoriphagus sp. D3-2-R+10]MEB2775930.1 VOC family protein [Algoriphagus sp. D3-2-R+10]
MTTINTYLTFEGNCENAFNFYRSVFGGEFAHVGRFSDMPDDPNYPVADEFRNQIMHISLPISKECVLMGSDTAGHGGPLTVGNNFSISISTDSKEKADTFFEKLSAEGSVTMPMDNTFWGDYFGMVTDRFGINWMIGFAQNQHQA